VEVTLNESDSSKRSEGCVVSHVYPGSPATRLGLKVGDRIVKINGQFVEDMLDLWFHGSEERVSLEWYVGSSSRGNNDRALQKKSVRKAFHERLGIEVEPFEIRRCHNACVFCFVHQNPVGVRRELYLKDEDYRLSFLYGNYITGTNLTEEDIQRILRLRLSPLYFSIHATDQELREKLLVKPGAAPIIPLLERLTAGGITIHGQVVLCPGWNDGDALEKTALDLSPLYPGVESVAVVPVGLTNHRARLPKLETISRDYARGFLRRMEKIQRAVKKRIGYPFIFPSDEWYLLAEEKAPSYLAYPELPQLGNGVGMIHRFYEEVDQVIDMVPRHLPGPEKVVVLTAPLGVKVIQPLIDRINATTKNLVLEPVVLTNSLYGPGITVTGLLPGRDFLSGIQSQPDATRFVLPENALRSWDRRFLDDMTFAELQEQSHAPILTAGDTAASFVEAVYSSSLLAC
jgi:putative radical SAM enzyme (TIGR03279 family)